MTQRAFITQEFFDEALSEFDGTEVEVEVRSSPEPLPYDELTARLGEYQGAITLLTDRIDEALLAVNPQLKVVANCAVGFDNIDVDAATRHGVLVTNTPEVLTDATADLTFSLLLGAARRLPEGDAFLRAGKYRFWRLHQEQIGLDVYGQVLGIFGLGKIGKAVAKRAKGGFGMTVLYYDAYRLDPEQERELGVEYVSFEELLERSDFVSVHAPLTPETRHAFDADAFARMKDSAVLVNSARGPIIDEAALAQALRSGAIAGAGLDVYEHEPEVHPDLLDIRERVVLLPHLGSGTERTRMRMARMAAANLREGVLGRVPQNLVNPDALETGRTQQ